MRKIQNADRPLAKLFGNLRQTLRSVMPASEPASSAIKSLIAKGLFRGADAPLLNPGSGPG